MPALTGERVAASGERAKDACRRSSCFRSALIFRSPLAAFPARFAQRPAHLYSAQMKRMAAVSAVVVVFVWAVMHFSRKPNDPTVEQMAEKFGRAARTRMAQKNQAAPQGL